MVKEIDEAKCIGQFKLQLNGTMQPFHFYGMDVHIPSAIEEITKLALKLHRRLNGEQIPIQK